MRSWNFAKCPMLPTVLSSTSSISWLTNESEVTKHPSKAAMSLLNHLCIAFIMCLILMAFDCLGLPHCYPLVRIGKSQLNVRIGKSMPQFGSGRQFENAMLTKTSAMPPKRNILKHMQVLVPSHCKEKCIDYIEDCKSHFVSQQCLRCLLFLHLSLHALVQLSRSITPFFQSSFFFSMLAALYH